MTPTPTTNDSKSATRLVSERLQELDNALRRSLEILTDLDTALSALPCQCGPCVEARACGVEMGAWT